MVSMNLKVCRVFFFFKDLKSVQEMKILGKLEARSGWKTSQICTPRADLKQIRKDAKLFGVVINATPIMKAKFKILLP